MDETFVAIGWGATIVFVVVALICILTVAISDENITNQKWQCTEIGVDNQCMNWRRR